MESDPNNKLPHSEDGDQEGQGLADPVVAYTSNGNLEAHSAVTWLESNGIPAHAVEDNSGASLFQFGTISQFHKPQVFVDRPDLDRARQLLRQFELQRQTRRRELADAPAIASQCEECGESSEFPATQNGTTQNCPKCNAYMDVGESDWPEDFDFAGEQPEPELPENAEDAIDAATQLERSGDWDEAIATFRAVAQRWPEHKTYIANCIAAVQRKIDASQS